MLNLQNRTRVLSILDYQKWNKNSDKEGGSNSKAETFNQKKRAEKIPWNDQVLQRYMALKVAYYCTINRTSFNFSPLEMDRGTSKNILKMKRVITRETLLAYPNFHEAFHIHSDASLYQLGTCASQNGKPIAFYSRMLNYAQTRYTATERELLSIGEVLKEFRNIFLGHQIRVHTAHESLTHKKFNSDRVMRWRFYIEEYSPDLQYIKGEHNVVADTLSRLDMGDEPTFQVALITEEMCSSWFCYTKAQVNYDSPLSIQQLDKVQQADKQMLKIQNMEK